MNFDYSSISHEMIVRSIIVIVVGIVIYKFRLKVDWHYLRKKDGLAQDSDCIPSFKDKNGLNKFCYFKPCLNIMLMSIVISICIMIVHALTVPNSSFKLDYNSIYTLPSLCLIILIFLDIPLDKDELISTEYSKIGHVYTAVRWFKEQILEGCVIKEKNSVIKSIDQTIDKWYSDWEQDKNNKFGILLLKISEDYIIKLIPENLSSDVIENFKQLKREVIILCGKDEISTISEEVSYFFTKGTVGASINFSVILKIIYSVITSKDSTDKKQIMSKLRGISSELEKSEKKSQVEARNHINHKNISQKSIYSLLNSSIAFQKLNDDDCS